MISPNHWPERRRSAFSNEKKVNWIQLFVVWISYSYEARSRAALLDVEEFWMTRYLVGTCRKVCGLKLLPNFCSSYFQLFQRKIKTFQDSWIKRFIIKHRLAKEESLFKRLSWSLWFRGLLLTAWHESFRVTLSERVTCKHRRTSLTKQFSYFKFQVKTSKWDLFRKPLLDAYNLPASKRLSRPSSSLFSWLFKRPILWFCQPQGAMTNRHQVAD